MKKTILIILLVFLSGCTQNNSSMIGDTVSCDAMNPCPEGYGCYVFEGSTEPVCYSGNPCDECESGNCNIAESYPMQVFCIEQELIIADYYSVTECETSCTSSGYGHGTCVWPGEATENYVDMGACYISQSRHCGNEGQCNCYCYNII